MSDPKSEEEPQKNEDSESEPDVPESSSSSESSSDSESDSEREEDADTDEDKPITYVRPDGTTGQVHPYDSDPENIPEVNIPLFERALNSKRLRRELEEEEEENFRTKHEDLFDFPPDPENWREEDLMELWADPPLGTTKTGWDPSFVDEEDVEVMSDEIMAGRDPPIAPFYVPYRKPYPAIPDNHYDIKNPKSVIEELDRIEEFLTWVSFIFEDGSTYEGTVWDDLAHGKGVFVAEQGLVRYEGEWLRNDMDGHGVVEVEIPIPEPIPGSKLEAKMRAEGRIISRDFMSPEDRKWLEMDIEDSILINNGEVEIPFYENEEWVRQFGELPEKGRYRYAGQWKHGRMHGCGVYEVNERVTFGRFYFGELLEDPYGCDEDISGLHAGIAEVAAAKARMFINKPDGMVREYYGPFCDPQHPYFYEEDDVWMAPGFINQFYEVPDYWKMYVHEVDQEREMWLNSFYKAPLRLPMPAELEHWWAQDHMPEFVLVNKEPEPDPNDPEKLIYTTDPLILHTPSGRLINYVEDEEYGVRLFWQPEVDEDEEFDPDKVEFLPLGFDEFYADEVDDKKDNIWTRFITAVQNVVNTSLDRLEKWVEEQKKAGEERKQLLKAELDLVEAELSLKEAMDDYDEVLKQLQKEEEKKLEVGDEKDSVSEPTSQVGETPPKPEAEVGEDGEEDDDDDDVVPSSFGSVEDQSTTKNEQNDTKSGKSTFAALSLSFGSSNLVSSVPARLQASFLRWKEGKFLNQSSTGPTSRNHLLPTTPSFSTVSFPRAATSKSLKLSCVRQMQFVQHIPKPTSRNLSRRKPSMESGTQWGHFNILSLHAQVPTQSLHRAHC